MSGTFIAEIPERDEKGRDLRRLMASWRVTSLPGHHMVIKKMQAKGSITVAADPGMYTWTAVHHDSDAPHLNFKFYGTILHDMTKEQWTSLQYIRPKVSRAIHTTRGTVWHCQFLGCNDSTTNRIAAAVHEAEHQGINLLSEPERQAEAGEAVAVVAEEMQATKGKRRGRPPKVGRPID